ncbi:MAG: Rrf2 family transcriptional regulator [Sphingomonadales bacterium]|nr:Rrf2 family transcriptional regulator [Sphingomonadales bacterium]
MSRDTRLSDVLHALLHMDQADGPMTSDLLARSLGTNPAVFRRTMAGLREAGLVTSEKGPGGGWRLARPLREVTLLAVYDALDRPNLFAIGNRSANPGCLIEKGVNGLLAETMADAEALFAARFGAITLDQIAPDVPMSLARHPESADPKSPGV